MSAAGHRLLSDVITHELRERIASGTWLPGTKIPAEIDLSDELGVSRTTLRVAMATLAAEGLLVRVHGRGTFVQTPGGELPLAQRLVTLSEVLRSESGEAHAEVLSHGFGRGDETARAVLDAGDEDLYVLRRRLMGASSPYAVLENYVSADIGRQLTSDFTQQGLYPAMEELGVKITWGKRTFEAVSNRQSAALLGLAEDKPLLYVEQITYDNHDRPVEFSRVWLPGEGNRITTHVRRNA